MTEITRITRLRFNARLESIQHALDDLVRYSGRMKDQTPEKLTNNFEWAMVATIATIADQLAKDASILEGMCQVIDGQGEK